MRNLARPRGQRIALTATSRHQSDDTAGSFFLSQIFATPMVSYQISMIQHLRH